MGYTVAVDPGDHHRWRTHVTTAAAAVATMAVIVGSALIANGGPTLRIPGVPDVPRSQLTDRAQLALDTLPLAYRAGDAVIVPAATDPNLDWVGGVLNERIAGQPVPMGARGLTSYADVPTSNDAPAWTSELRHVDRVFADVGPLWLACTRWPGEDGCTASLLMRHDLDYHSYRSGVGAPDFLDEDAPMEVLTFDSIDGTELRKLVVGGMNGTAAEEVRLTLADGSSVSALTSVDTAVPGETMWWTTVSLPVRSVTAYGPDGQVIARAQLLGDP